jgi:hypothetical protein
MRLTNFSPERPILNLLLGGSTATGRRSVARIAKRRIFSGYSVVAEMLLEGA